MKTKIQHTKTYTVAETMPRGKFIAVYIYIFKKRKMLN